VWLYVRFTLSLHDVEELLVKRGITVSYETVRRWCLTFGASTLGAFADNALFNATAGIRMKSSCRLAVNDITCGARLTRTVMSSNLVTETPERQGRQTLFAQIAKRSTSRTQSHCDRQAG
jgi:hypothetical protein